MFVACQECRKQTGTCVKGRVEILQGKILPDLDTTENRTMWIGQGADLFLALGNGYGDIREIKKYERRHCETRKATVTEDMERKPELERSIQSIKFGGAFISVKFFLQIL